MVALKNKKRLLLVTAGVIAVFLVLAFNAFAGSKNSDTVENRLKLPSLAGEIKEEFEPNTNITIGSSKKKDVTIANTGDADLFVRVMVLPMVESAGGKLLPAGIGAELTVDLGADWRDGQDGYYYYIKKVVPETSTASLFTEVKLADNLGKEYEEASLSIQIKSETITNFQYEYREAWWNTDQPPAGSALQEIDQALETQIR